MTIKETTRVLRICLPGDFRKVVSLVIMCCILVSLFIFLEVPSMTPANASMALSTGFSQVTSKNEDFVLTTNGLTRQLPQESGSSLFNPGNSHYQPIEDRSGKSVPGDDVRSYVDPPQQQQQDYIIYLPIIFSNNTGPLRVHPTNPRYFSDGSGRLIYLTGSHTWQNLVDHGQTNPPPVFNYPAYLDFLVAQNHNFFRLWAWEQTKYAVWDASSNFTFAQSPYQRTGPGLALDGRPKFDLNKFDQSYFDRLRQRVIDAQARDIYVAIMLFNGWSPVYPKGSFAAQNSWLGHPFHKNNNINGINGDPNNDQNGAETHTLQIAAVTQLQEAYVRKVIDTVNDLDNVLYEISNESDGTATAWQYHFIDYVKWYESTKPKQHPVGMTVEWPGGDNAELFASNADWISPNGTLDPPVANGSKVIIADTDHLCGICGNRQWVWKSFLRGENPIFMDGNDGANYGWHPEDAQWNSLRANMGYTLTYANRINLAKMTPRPDLCSTGYCLANPAASGAEYLVYLPAGGTATVNLSATSGSLSVEWFNPATGAAIAGGATTGGASRSFTAPFSGDAVLYLYQ